MSYPEPINEMRIEPEKKIWVSYLLWFIFGGIGAHNLYLRDNNRAALLASLFVSSRLLEFFDNFFIGLISIALYLTFFVFWIIDAFRIPKKVDEFNRNYAL